MLNKFGIGFLGLLFFCQTDVFAEVKFRKAFMKAKNPRNLRDGLLIWPSRR